MEAVRTLPWMKDGRWIVPLGMAVYCLPALVALSQKDWNTEAGSLTPLILLLGLWTTVQTIENNRPLFGAGPLRPVLGALVAVSLGYLFASAIGVVLLMAVCAWAGCVLALWAWRGGAIVWACRFPLAFLGLAVPLPYSLSTMMTERLRAQMAASAVELADRLGLDVAYDRTSIFVNQFRLALEAACAGTSSTITLVAFVLLFTYWYRGRDWRRTLLCVALAVPIAWGANILRVVVLIVAVDRFGAPVLDTLIHPVAGLLSFSIALGLFLAVDRGLRSGLRLIDGVRHA
ncbi:exosortase/archaeosortase family protein [Aurantiacibacter xanthus]|uniref:Exosortase/archaeosortase family protein n=1 Tax=Aurantiacibacter xanthus TaxID=1784712 RepID=A0A3A1PBI6_9SPHN|nr:exosortase/archaeosortase family protein [Aurantiacibacter xanthus]RIV90328.1 exosortase/archaeosortase family protein [Aurantiacibacter xanthus]